jgi:hypothetical protein
VLNQRRNHTHSHLHTLHLHHQAFPVPSQRKHLRVILVAHPPPSLAYNPQHLRQPYQVKALPLSPLPFHLPCLPLLLHLSLHDNLLSRRLLGHHISHVVDQAYFLRLSPVINLAEFLRDNRHLPRLPALLLTQQGFLSRSQQ